MGVTKRTNSISQAGKHQDMERDNNRDPENLIQTAKFA